jgi:hypothetical protein
MDLFDTLAEAEILVRTTFLKTLTLAIPRSVWMITMTSVYIRRM